MTLLKKGDFLKQPRSLIVRIIALCLVCLLVFPITTFASENNTPISRASYYLDAYNTYICDLGGGKIQIWYEVMGTGYMDEIGTLSIELYEVNGDGSLTWIKTFQHENYSSMLAYDDYYHCSYVSYQGSSSKTYKAYVCIWAGKNGSGDTRYKWALE